MGDILNEKLIPAKSFDIMYHTHAFNQCASNNFIPLTVSAVAFMILHDSKSTAEKIWTPYKHLNLLPDYEPLQSLLIAKPVLLSLQT